MWILGTLAPLPNEMTWRSSEAEAAIAQSMEILGPFGTLLTTQRDSSSHFEPDSLQSILPPRSYARWLSLKATYLENDTQTDEMTPTAAALLLQKGAYEKGGLSYADQVWNTISDLAKSDHIAIGSLILRTDLNDSKHRSRRPPSMDREFNFLEATMSRIESDARSARARANAWAVGDLTELKRLTKNDDCHTTLLADEWPYLTGKESSEVLARAQGQLVGEIDYAIRRYAASFAAIPICLLLQKHGFLSDLGVNGVSVNEP